MISAKGKVLFTSESVTEGHPDKMCDMISDAILDEAITQDPDSRVAIECATKTGMVAVLGEMTSKAHLNIPRIVRDTIKFIGYDKGSLGIEWETCAVIVHLEPQSPDISRGVTIAEGHKEQGAGDQGMMFGYACNETKELMPLPILLAHKLAKRLTEARKENEIRYIGPDGKTLVTVEYEDGIPKRVDTVVISAQHEDGIDHATIHEDIKSLVIDPILSDWIDIDTKVYVNPTGIFVRGGPYADACLTGRKIIVDTYGGMGRHGGGAFSGKDPSKVDRSAAYAARYIAKHIVASGLATHCEVQLSYAIGVADPLSVFVNTFNTSKVPEKEIAKVVPNIFPVKPADIILHLGLKKPIYRKTSAYGHFGRNRATCTWENTDKVGELKKEFKLE